MIRLPEAGAGLEVIASVSGGKDSTALILALREAAISARFVFADTGWEAPETYAYLDMLRARLEIAIDVVRSERGGMVQIARRKAGFPHRQGRWCTEQLKMIPLRAYHEAVGIDTINAVGVRGDESAKRAAMPEWEDDADWGGYVWRPLIRWTVEDVLSIHHRHGVPVNPLYLRGHDRVGCYPCINEGKEGIRLVAEHAPWRIDEIRTEERAHTAERAARNANGTGDFKHPVSTFFSARTAGGPAGIDEVVEWSRTDRGGKQLVMAKAPTGGCMRWGMCEAPPRGEDDEP